MTLSPLRSRPRSFTVLAVCFALIAGFTTISLLAVLVQFGIFMGRDAVYAAMGLLLMYAFLSCQRWLPWALGANLVGVAVFAATSLVRGSLSWPLLVSLVLNALVLWWVIRHRKALRRRHSEYVSGGLFFLLWVVLLVYTIYVLLA